MVNCIQWCNHPQISVSYYLFTLLGRSWLFMIRGHNKHNFTVSGVLIVFRKEKKKYLHTYLGKKKLWQWSISAILPIRSNTSIRVGPTCKYDNINETKPVVQCCFRFFFVVEKYRYTFPVSIFLKQMDIRTQYSYVWTGTGHYLM